MQAKSLFVVLGLLIFMNSVAAQEPELIFPTGHTANVRTARFSSDEKFIVTAGTDKTINVWEAKSGKKLHSFESFESEIVYAYFSNDNKFLVAGTISTAIIWSVPSYKLLGRFDSIRRVMFSPDSKQVFLCGYNGLTIQLQLPTLKRQREYTDSIFLKTDYYGLYSTTALSPDGKLISIANSSGLVIRETKTGHVVSQITINEKLLKSFFSLNGKELYLITKAGIRSINLVNGFQLARINESVIASAYVSRNNRFLLTISGESREPKAVLWDIKKTQPVFKSDTLLPRFDTIITISNKNEIQTTIINNAFPVRLISRMGGNSVEISNDGNWIRAGSLVYNFQNNTTCELPPSYLRVSDISQDSHYILTQGPVGTISLFAFEDRKNIQTYTSRIETITMALISPDGKKILYGDNGPAVKVVDLLTSRLLYQLKHDDNILHAEFSRDGSQILTNSLDSTARLWDSQTGKLLETFQTKLAPVFFSADDTLRFIEPMYDTVPVHDIKDPAKILNYVVEPISYTTQMVSFLRNKQSNNDRFQLEKTDTSLLLKNNVNNRLIDLTSLAPADKFIHAFSRDEKLLAIAPNKKGDTLIILDAEKGYEKFRLNLGIIARNRLQAQIINQLFFTPDNNYLLAVDGNEVIHVLSTTNFKQLYSLPGSSCSISDDEKFLVVLNKGRYDVYDFDNHRFLYRYLAVDSTNYLVTDSLNRYDGTSAARKLLYFSCGNEIMTLDQAKDLLWVPNLSERTVKGDAINAPSLSDLNLCGLAPSISNATIKNNYQFIITPRRGLLGEIILYINGIEIRKFQAGQLARTNTGYLLKIERNSVQPYLISGRENVMSIKAFTKDNTIYASSEDIIEEKKQQPDDPNFFAVMVGVNDYKGDELDLKYPDKDAKDLSEVINLTAKKFFNSDKGEHVFIYNINTSHDHSLFPEKKAIKKVFEEIGRKSQPNDILFIFFAGHGIMEGEKKQFYFLTADASLEGSIPSTGISIAELSEWMKPDNIKAQKRVLIFDACNSGQAINDLVTIGDKEQKYVAVRGDSEGDRIKAIEKLNEKSGLFILSASASKQSAYEMDRYSQGLLTYALLKAIKEQTYILDEGKYLNVDKWFATVEKIVTDISQKNNRQQPQKFGTGGFEIGVVDEDVINKITLPQEKFLFKASNFQNSDEKIADDDLELSKQVNLQLNDFSNNNSKANIFYLEASNSPDAWSLSGRYKVNNTSVTVMVNLKKNKEIIHRFQINGSTEDFIDLAKAIVEKASVLVK